MKIFYHPAHPSLTIMERKETPPKQIQELEIQQILTNLIYQEIEQNHNPMQVAKDLMEGKMETANNPEDLIYSLMETQGVQTLIWELKNSKAKVRELPTIPRTEEQMILQEEYEMNSLSNFLTNLTNWMETR